MELLNSHNLSTTWKRSALLVSRVTGAQWACSLRVSIQERTAEPWMVVCSFLPAMPTRH